MCPGQKSENRAQQSKAGGGFPATVIVYLPTVPRTPCVVVVAEVFPQIDALIEIESDSIIKRKMSSYAVRHPSGLFSSAVQLICDAVQTADSKKEEFRNFLEKAGVIDALTKGASEF